MAAVAQSTAMAALDTQNLARGTKAVGSGRGRRIAIVVHRYVGLVMTVFLVVAGLTGSLLLFGRHRADPPWPRRR